MPKVGKKHFPYTDEGYKDAAKEKRRKDMERKSKEAKKGGK